jgi:hypothetical protein
MSPSANFSNGRVGRFRVGSVRLKPDWSAWGVYALGAKTRYHDIP